MLGRFAADITARLAGQRNSLMTSVFSDKLRWQYLVRSAVNRFRPMLRRCPCCRTSDYKVVKSKMLVTTLVRCRNCQLLYRLPQDQLEFNAEFYQDDYQSGFATTCPTEPELRVILETGFSKTEKNLSQKLALLEALNISTDSRLLDYGASWGYGTWQFVQAGFEAVGFEISRARAEYARQMLGVQVEDHLDELEGPFDVIFTVHVLEHLPTPTLAFDLAKRLLRPGGLFVAYTPNGSEKCRQANPRRYHESWGRLHPLYLDEAFYQSQLADHPKMFASSSYGTQFDLEQISNWDQRSDLTLDLSLNELLTVVVF